MIVNLYLPEIFDRKLQAQNIFDYLFCLEYCKDMNSIFNHLHY